MSHYKNSTVYTDIENKMVLSFDTEPENGYLGNVKISWKILWLLIKAKFKSGTLYLCPIPLDDDGVRLYFYREKIKTNNKKYLKYIQ